MLSMLPKRTAILVDGGYYRVRSADLWGKKSANDRANELYKYIVCYISQSRRSQGSCIAFSTTIVPP